MKRILTNEFAGKPGRSSSNLLEEWDAPEEIHWITELRFILETN